MGRTPSPDERAKGMTWIDSSAYVTIEPILDFDLMPLVALIKKCSPVQVNIGADSGGNNLPEPTAEKIQSLIYELSAFTKVNLKKNLHRLHGPKGLGEFHD
jgi:hypothetical protein